MKKKTIVSFATVFGLVAAGTVGVLTAANQVSKARAGYDYAVTFSSSKNVIDSDGAKTLKTDKGSDVGFNISGFDTESDIWGVLEEGGYIENTTAISGLYQLGFYTGNSKGKVMVEWGWEKGVENFHPLAFEEIEFDSGQFWFGFKDEMPSYFRMTALTDLTLNRGEINFSCEATTDPGHIAPTCYDKNVWFYDSSSDTYNDLYKDYTFVGYDKNLGYGGNIYRDGDDWKYEVGGLSMDTDTYSMSTFELWFSTELTGMNKNPENWYGSHASARYVGLGGKANDSADIVLSSESTGMKFAYARNYGKEDMEFLNEENLRCEDCGSLSIVCVSGSYKGMIAYIDKDTHQMKLGYPEIALDYHYSLTHVFNLSSLLGEPMMAYANGSDFVSCVNGSGIYFYNFRDILSEDRTDEIAYAFTGADSLSELDFISGGELIVQDGYYPKLATGMLAYLPYDMLTIAIAASETNTNHIRSINICADSNDFYDLDQYAHYEIVDAGDNNFAIRCIENNKYVSAVGEYSSEVRYLEEINEWNTFTAITIDGTFIRFELTAIEGLCFGYDQRTNTFAFGYYVDNLIMLGTSVYQPEFPYYAISTDVEEIKIEIGNIVYASYDLYSTDKPSLSLPAADDSLVKLDASGSRQFWNEIFKINASKISKYDAYVTACEPN